MTGRVERRRLDYAGAIERLRRGLGMTREALAEASGVSASFLSEVERGLKRPSTDVLAKVAEALGMAPSELLAYVETLETGAGESPGPDRAATPRPLPITPRRPAQTAQPGPTDIAPPRARRAWASTTRFPREDRIVPERAAPPPDLPTPPADLPTPLANLPAPLQEPVQEHLSPPPPAASPAPRPTPPTAPTIDPRDQAMGMLVALASRLDEEDLRLLIDLARRLRERQGEPGS